MTIRTSIPGAIVPISSPSRPSIRLAALVRSTIQRKDAIPTRAGGIVADCAPLAIAVATIPAAIPWPTSFCRGERSVRSSTRPTKTTRISPRAR